MRLIDADAIELKARKGIDEDGLLFIPYADVKKSIDNTPTISQWIPVSERLPEFRKQVLCCNKDGRVFTSCLTHIHIYFGGVFGQHYEVIAWMPLPEPYKEDDE